MDDDAQVALPPGIDLLWGLRPRPRRGPKPTLSLDRIVAKAVEIADAEGLGPLSMSRLAEDLGFTTMSLYRYVASKDELLTLMMNTAAADVPVPSDPAEGWRPGLARWARETLVLFRRHPWALQIPISGPPLEPNNLAWMEYGLRSLAGTGLAAGEKIGVILLINGYVRNEARLSGELAQGMQQRSSAQPTPTYGQALRRLLDPEKFPYLWEIVESGVFDDDESYGDAEFEFGLERVLDGIEALVRERSAGSASADLG